MKNWMWIVVLIAVATALGAQSAKNPKGVFSMIKLGQAVNLKDQGAAYSISFMEPEVPLGHTVVEIGEDYVVVRDIAGVKDVVVPVYSLKSVEKVRTKLE
ncbi:MAG: hypothetical protein ABGZ35_33265 [Planctomycetaceae bacterium]